MDIYLIYNFSYLVVRGTDTDIIIAKCQNISVCQEYIGIHKIKPSNYIILESKPLSGDLPITFIYKNKEDNKIYRSSRGDKEICND